MHFIKPLLLTLFAALASTSAIPDSHRTLATLEGQGGTDSCGQTCIGPDDCLGACTVCNTKSYFCV